MSVVYILFFWLCAAPVPLAQGESYLSELGYIIAHSAYSAVYQYVRIVGFQKVVGLQLHAQPVIEECFV